jgi:hypothetical protein
MKQAYKNKRDYYKAEAQQERIAKELAQERLAALEKKCADAKKVDQQRYEAIVYCNNCMHVKEVRVPIGLRIDEGDCTNCRVRSCVLNKTLFKVVSYPGKR